MTFFKQDLQEPNHEAPASELTRSAGISDLQRLLTSLDSKITCELGEEDDDIQIRLVDDEISEEGEGDSFSLAPVPPTSPEPNPILITRPAPTKQLTFENAGNFVQKMELFLNQSVELSMDKPNQLAGFLNQEENSAYLAKWKILLSGMGQFLFAPNANHSAKEFNSFLHAFSHFKATKGFSMSCYLTLHNQSLGEYLLQNEADFNELNDAFLCYLKPVKSDAAKKR